MDVNQNFRDQVQDLFPLERKAPVNEKVEVEVKDELSALRNRVQNMMPLSESEQQPDVQEKDSVFNFPKDLPERVYEDDSDKDRIRENVSNAVSDKKLDDMLNHLFM